MFFLAQLHKALSLPNKSAHKVRVMVLGLHAVDQMFKWPLVALPFLYTFL